MIDSYSLIRPGLFCLDPEHAHNLTLNALDRAQQCGLLQHWFTKPAVDPRILCGITFPNPIGLAAGLDKDGKHIDALAALGFGFNNDGVHACVARVRQSNYWNTGGVLGINIGKNASTPIEDASSDYVLAMETVYEAASYITVNISSPNTKNLRDLQGEQMLRELLSSLEGARNRLSDQYGVRKPLFLKIAPDLNMGDIELIANLLLEFGIDAVIATNTTIARDQVANLEHGNEVGGLSGRPVRAASTNVIRALKQSLGNAIPIIGVGGILSGSDAREKIDAGASLIQLYSGLIYQGPRLITECAKALHSDH